MRQLELFHHPNYKPPVMEVCKAPEPIPEPEPPPKEDKQPAPEPVIEWPANMVLYSDLVNFQFGENETKPKTGRRLNPMSYQVFGYIETVENKRLFFDDIIDLAESHQDAENQMRSLCSQLAESKPEKYRNKVYVCGIVPQVSRWNKTISFFHLSEKARENIINVQAVGTTPEQDYF